MRTLTTKTERRINLLYILEDGLWHYLEDLASSLRTNTDNLKEDLNDLVKINYLNSFKNLDEIKQKQEKEIILKF